MPEKVCVIVLNYNRWFDTIECLESLLRQEYQNFQLVVIDNNSQGYDIENIRNWANGKIDVWVPKSNPLHRLSNPAVEKPVECLFVDEDNLRFEGKDDQKLIIVRSSTNTGYAGGNNIGIKYALSAGDFDYVWILNNDTVQDSDSLGKLVEYARAKRKTDRIGIVGSKLLFYDKPTTLQGIGGIYNRWMGYAKTVGVFEEDRGQYDKEVRSIDYAIGASLFVAREFIEEIGFMCEDYFLYFEELDWATRGKKKGWAIAYCYQSVVYHKEGSSAGSNSQNQLASEMSDYYLLRNKILYARKHTPYFLLTIYLGFIIVLVNRIRRRQFKRVGIALRAMLNLGFRSSISE